MNTYKSLEDLKPTISSMAQDIPRFQSAERVYSAYSRNHNLDQKSDCSSIESRQHSQ